MRSVIDSKEHLIEVAVNVLAREGFAGSSLRMIAVEAGVSPALLVHHFGSRQGLIEEAINKTLGEWLDAKDVLTAEGLTEALKQWPEVAEDGQTKLQFFKQLMVAGGKPAQHLFERMVFEAKSRLEVFQNQGLMKPMSDVESAAVLMASYALAPLLMGEQIKKVLGGDFFDPKVSERLALSSVELFGLSLPAGKGAAKTKQKAGDK